MEQLMPCKEVQQFVLAKDWDAVARREALAALQHLDACLACQASVEDYDALRLLLQSPRNDLHKTCPPLNYMPSQVAHQTWRQTPSVLKAGFACAAFILLFMGMFIAGRKTARVAPPSFSQPPSVIASAPIEPFGPVGIKQEIGAFREIFQEFDGQASWILVSKENWEMGTVDKPISPEKRLVLLRLSLARGAKIISESDLIVVAGQDAELNVPLSAGQSLNYRIGTSSEGPTRLTVRAEMRQSPGNEPLGALAATLQPPRGQSLTAGQLRTNGGDYDLKLRFTDASFSGETIIDPVKRVEVR